MDDNADTDLLLQQQVVLLFANRQQRAGRSKGQPIFKIDEDLKLASAYALVGTNAAVGTDQDGNTFWHKVRENFMRRGGAPERTIISLQNRFNKVLQCEVQKYIGYLQGALREYHSGWIMEDYVHEAKRQFQNRQGKHFKHEMVYSVLKRGLPKFELVVASVDARVSRALFLLDNDLDLVSAAEQGQGVNCNINNNQQHDTAMAPRTARNVFASVESNCADADVCDTSLITPRPSIGKKKAKEIAYGRSSRPNSKHQFDTPSSVENRRLAVELTNKQKCKHYLVLTRIAEVAEAKHKFAQEKLLSQIYLQNPNSARAKAFFARMENRYDSEEDEAGGLTLRDDYGSEDDKEDVVFEPAAARRAPVVADSRRRAPAGPVFDSRRAPAAAAVIHSRRPAPAAVIHSRQPPAGAIDSRRAPVAAVVVLRRAHPLVSNPPNDECYDDDDDEMDSLPPLPNTQNLMAMVRAMEKRSEHPRKEAAFDSQATTLDEQYDDSMDPRAIILGDLRDCVSYPPAMIDFSRIKGSDFNDSDNDDKQE